MILVPLTITQINFPALLKTLKEEEGRDLARTLDLGSELLCPASYLKILKQFGHCIEAKAYKYLHYSFLTDESDLDDFNLDIVRSSKALVTMKHLPDEWLYIVGGNLNQWKEAVLRGSCKDNLKLEFFNGVHQIFQTYGLNLWSDCRKHDTGQGTFYLEQK